MASSSTSPRRVGPYAIERELGRGGMGAVYLGQHVETGARHAVKVVLGQTLGETAFRRFEREAQVLARLSHPGIVTVHGCGLHEGSPWCSMEHVPGRSLAEVLKAGPLAPDDAARLLAAVARAAEHAHGHGIVHRDIKPANILIGDDGAPRLIDFGLAYDVFAERLSQTGTLLGTVHYMAPEQAGASSTAIGPATDVWGLGAVLYETLSGRTPFESVDGSAIAIVGAILRRPPTPIGSSGVHVPPELEAVCEWALRKEPARRYPFAAALADDLERFVATGSTAALDERRRFRRGRAVKGGLLSALVVALASVAAVLSLGERPRTDPERGAGGAPEAARPRAAPTPDDARRVADGITPPPSDDAGLVELVELPGLADDVRGRLLILRATRIAHGLEGEDSDAAAAAVVVNLLLRAADLGVRLERLEGEGAVEHVVWRRFVDRIEAGSADAATVLDVVVRIAGEACPLSVAEIAAAQRALRPPRRDGGDEVEVALLLAAALDVYGLSPLSEDLLLEFWTGLDHAWSVARAEREMARPPGRRNAALLLLLARIACFREYREHPGWEGLPVVAWADAALATGIERRWLRFGWAVVLEWQDRTDPALEALREAHRLERELPLEQRWPAIGDRVVDGITDVAYREAWGTSNLYPSSSDGVEDLELVVRLLDEALDVAIDTVDAQLAVDARVAAIVAAGGAPPALLDRDDELVRQLYEAARGRLAVTDRAPCCRSGAGAVARALTAALCLDLTDRRRALVLKDSGWHARIHGDGAAAARLSLEAVEMLQRYLRHTPDAKPTWWQELRETVNETAKVLVEQGRRDEAERVVAEARRLIAERGAKERGD